MIVKRKVVLLGDGAVGKTSLIRRFVLDQFDDKYIITIGTKVVKKDVMVGDSKVSLVVWDVLGQQTLFPLQALSIKGSKGAILVADLTRKETLISLTNFWIPQIHKIIGSIPMVFLANKADLKGRHQFDHNDLMETAQPYGARTFLTSASTGQNVERAFYFLGKTMLQDR